MVKPDTCIPCPLYERSNGFSQPDGTGSLGIMFIGEALGYEEYLDGLPFRPRAVAGSMLSYALRLVAEAEKRPISREGFKFWNVIACNPPGNKLEGERYEREAIQCCDQYFSRIVGNSNGYHNSNGMDSLAILDQTNEQTSKPNRRNSNVIIPLGNTALKKVTGVSGIANEKQSISHLRGYVLDGPYGLVIPSLHPAYIKRGMEKLTPLLVEDIRKAIRVKNNSFQNFPNHPSYQGPVYNCGPSLDDVCSFLAKIKANSQMAISFDIETTSTVLTEEDERDQIGNEDIQQIQFCTDNHDCISIPFQHPYINAIREILCSPNAKYGHNCWNFDIPRLESYLNIKVEGRIDDTMWMFKQWNPGLPRGLQNAASLFGFAFPWKHLFGSNLPWYGCADVHATYLLYTEVKKKLEGLGIWKGYDSHVQTVYHYILKPASDRGVPVAEDRRLNLEKDFKSKRKVLDEEIQELIPDEIKNVKRWKKGPNYLKEARQRYDAIKSTGKPIVTFERFVERRYGLRYHAEGDYRYSEIQEFVASSQQLIRYLRWKQEQCRSNEDREVRSLAKFYEVPLTLNTKRETTNKDELEDIWVKTDDSVLEKVMEIRSLDTNINNYIPNWKPRQDSKVHCEWSFSPPQGQTATRAPNIQNCSKHTKYGQMFRRIVEAPRGYHFIEFDKRRFHVASMGYIANDPTYIRFAANDSHSIFTSHICSNDIQPISISLRDDLLLDKVKEVKEWNKWNLKKTGIDVRQEQAKPSVLGNQLGLGPRKLQWQNRRSIQAVYIKDEKRLGVKISAERMQCILAELFPKVHAYKDYIVNIASRQRELTVKEWGYRQCFFNIFEKKFNKSKQVWEERRTNEAEKALALVVQGTAFGMMKYEWLKMDAQGIMDRYNFINTIHDSNMFLCHDNLVDSCIRDVVGIMNESCHVLLNDSTRQTGGLVVKVDVKMGRNWQDYHVHDENCIAGCEIPENMEGMRELTN